jgi:hypothetical protein
VTNNVLQLMTKVLGTAFAGETWATWRAVLKAAHALALTDNERAIVETLTHRQTLPSYSVRELWLLLGRRSGKSIIAGPAGGPGRRVVAPTRWHPAKSACSWSSRPIESKRASSSGMWPACSGRIRRWR